MATTSLSLDEHWEVYIKNESASARYGYARKLSGKHYGQWKSGKANLSFTKSFGAGRAEQATASEFIYNFTMDSQINDLDNEA